MSQSKRISPLPTIYTKHEHETWEMLIGKQIIAHTNKINELIEAHNRDIKTQLKGGGDVTTKR